MFQENSSWEALELRECGGKHEKSRPGHDWKGGGQGRGGMVRLQRLGPAALETCGVWADS